MPLLFGDCLFDSERRVLSRAAQEVHLTPKAFRLLELLIEKRPNPVSKGELMSTLWPDAVVAEGSLSIALPITCPRSGARQSARTRFRRPAEH